MLEIRPIQQGDLEDVLAVEALCNSMEDEDFGTTLWHPWFLTRRDVLDLVEADSARVMVMCRPESWEPEAWFAYSRNPRCLDLLHLAAMPHAEADAHAACWEFLRPRAERPGSMRVTVPDSEAANMRYRLWFWRDKGMTMELKSDWWKGVDAWEMKGKNPHD